MPLPFHELTRLGQVRRLRTLAEQALVHYDLDVQRLRLLATDTNVLFRVDTRQRRSFVLRLTAPNEHGLAEIEAEIAWLTALNEETDFVTLRPVQAKNGRFHLTLTTPAIPEPRHCVLFIWVPGSELADQLTPANYHKLGILAARLHQHAHTFTPPTNFQPMVWDKVFYWPGESSDWENTAFDRFFPPKRRTLFQTLTARVQAELDRLFASPQKRHVLHGDLHLWNVKVKNGRLYPIDFEDLMWGYPVQDVAITLFYGRLHKHYSDLRAAFNAGYSTLQPWPVEYPGQLELLMAGRTLMFVNYVLTQDKETDLVDYVERAEKRFEQYMAEFG
jgi:Ser/Thr protein kinase RdoA (MazF antagonist)